MRVVRFGYQTKAKERAMYDHYRTADVAGLADFRFFRTRVLTWGDGIVVTHSWQHIPTGDDAGGFGTKADAVRSARSYRDALRAEAARQ